MLIATVEESCWTIFYIENGQFSILPANTVMMNPPLCAQLCGLLTDSRFAIRF